MKQIMKAAGPAVQALAAAALSPNEIADEVAFRNVVKLFKLALKGREAGLTMAEFVEFVNVVRMERQVVTSFDIEMSGAISSNLEEADGSEFNINLTAGGSIGGFGLQGGANYGTSSRRSFAERTNENFKITLKASTYPESNDQAYIQAISSWAWKIQDPVTVPELPDDLDFGSLIERLLPLVGQILPDNQ